MERRVLCPSCGSRPRWASKIATSHETIERHWWCPKCFALIEIGAASTAAPQVIDRYVEAPPTEAVPVGVLGRVYRFH